MRYVSATALMAALVALCAPVPAVGQGLLITNYKFMGEQRLSQIDSYVTYRADLVNTGSARTAVTASLSVVTPNVRLVPGQTNLHFSPVPANSTVTSTNTFTILVDRSVTFDFASLQWSFLAPVANAGPNQSATVGTTVTLDGTRTTNPSGIGTLSYSWAFASRPAGTTAVLQNAFTATPSFRVDLPGDYVIILAASNGAGSDTASVTVSTNNTPPVANAGPNQTVAIGATVFLNGSLSSDIDGNPLTYSWSLISLPSGSAAVLANPNTVSPTFVADKAGTYVARLVVNDGRVNSTPSTVTISTGNTPPVADAGAPQTVKIGSLVQLSGVASHDVDGNPLTYQWLMLSKPAGSAAVLSSTTAVNPTFTADVAGTYTIQLTVNDGFINSTPANTTVTTNAVLAPTANAGNPQTVARRALVTLNGSGTDPQGLPLTYFWSFNSRPSGSTAAFSSPTVPGPSFTADIPGTYVAQLIVNNGVLPSAPSTVTINATNSAPTATIGVSPAANVPVGTTVTLGGLGSSDPDNDPLTYAWSLSSRPAGSTAVISPATSSSPTLFLDVAGNYVVQLIVSDGLLTSNTATALIVAGGNTITLTPSPLNVNLAASGTLQVTLSPGAGASGLDLNVASSDPSVASVPSTVTVPANSTGVNIPVTPLREGSTTIVASASGFRPGVATVNVVGGTPKVLVSLDSATVGVSRSINGTITLTTPAPAGGVSVLLSANPPGIVSLPGTVNIPADSSTGTFTVTGVAAGSALILAVAPGYSSGTANISAALVGAINLQAGITVGPGQSVPMNVSLVIAAPLGGVTVALTSSDPSKATISPGTVFIAQGATTPAAQPTLTGVALGTATISASAPGFTGTSQPVTVAASLAFVPATLTVGVNATQNLNLTLSSAAPAGGQVVNLSSSDPNIASVSSTVTIPANATSVNVPVTGLVAGNVVIHASALPGLADVTANVTVVNLGSVILQSGVSLALGATATFNVSLSTPAPAAGLTVTLLSGDSSKLTISPATLSFAAGSTTPSAQPQITGVNVGTIQISATAPGYAPAAQPVQVTASVAFSPLTLTLGAGTSQTLTLTLSAPAPAAGISVTLSSATPAVATVPSTVTFNSGANTAAVLVTGMSVGVAVIHASGPNIPDTTATVTVTNAGTVNVPGSTTLSLGASALLSISLSGPAPAGGVTVTLTSSDPRVTVSPSVFVAANATTPATQPTITGVNLGSATITAAAPNYTAGSGVVQVTGTISFSSASITVSPGGTQNLTLILSGPAPAAGIAVNTNSSDTSKATVPATVTFPGGATTVPVPVTGVGVGSAVIHASNANLADTTANVTVIGSGIILPAGVTMQLGQRVDFPVSLASPAPFGGVFVSLSSSDSSTVSITPSTVIISEGKTAPNAVPQVQANSLGSANIRASATGFADVVQAVQVTASLNFFPSTLPFTGAGTQNASLTLSATAPGSGVSITLTSSDTTVATVPASATIQSGQNNVNVPVTATGKAGVATITANSSTPNVTGASLGVSVAAGGAITVSPVTVGLGQSAPLVVSLATASASPVTVTLVSGNPSKVGLSSSSVLIPAGQTTPTTPALVTGTDIGTSTITASAAGFSAGSATATVNATITPSTPSLTVVAGSVQSFTLALSAAAPASGLPITLTSSSPGVATVPGTLNFLPDGSSFTTLVVPVTGVAQGTAVITAGAPPFVPNVSVTVNVTTDGVIVLQSGVIVGPNQTAPFAVSLASAAPASGVTVTLVSSDTSKVTISPGSVFIAGGQTTPQTQPTVTGVGSGTANITASAPNYVTATQSVQVASTMTFSAAQPMAVGAVQNLTLTVSSPAPAAGLTINLVSFDPGVATVPASVLIPSGQKTVTVPVTATGQGTSTILAGAQGLPNASVVITVQNQPVIVLPSGVNLSLGQSGAFNLSLLQAPAANLTVTLASSDPSKVSIAPGTVTVLAGQLTPSVQPTVTGAGLGSALISASATGYTSTPQTVTVGAVLTLPANATVTVGNTVNLTLTLSSPAPAAGLRVNLQSSDPSKASVPANVTILSGDTTATVVVTGLAAGPSTILASAPNVTGASTAVTVQQNGAITLQSGVTIGLGTSAPFAVSLTTPAPAIGVTVQLASTDGSKVTILPINVTIAAGQLVPASQPFVTGVGLGSANITATATGYADATPQPVAVNATMSFSTPNPMAVGTIQNLVVTLSGPAPAGLALNLTSSNPNIASVPGSVTFVAGATTVQVPVTGVTQGAVTITASANAPNLPNAAASVTVGGIGSISVQAVSVSLGQSAPLNVTLSVPAPTTTTVALSSSDTSKVTVTPASLTFNANSTTPTVQPTVSGVNPGAATITASANGWTQGAGSALTTATVSFLQQNATIVGLNTQNLTLTLSAQATAPVTVNLSSSNPSVAAVGQTATFSIGSTSVLVPVTGVSVGGPVTIHASALPYIPDATANVTVASAGSINLSNASVALGQSVAFPVTLPVAAPAGGVTVALSSSDPRVTVTPTISFLGGQTTPSSGATVTGVNVGSATITATAPGYTTNSATVQVSASVTFQAPLTLFAGDTKNLVLQLSAPAPTGGVTVNLNSASTGVATVSSTATFTSGNSTATAQVTGVSTGTSVIHASGLNIPDATTTVTVQPATGGGTITITPISVGKDLEAPINVKLSSLAPAGGQRITLTSGDPSKLLIGRQSFPGSGTFSFDIAEGLDSASVFLQALAGTGSVTLQATSGGYGPAAVDIPLTPSGFVMAVGTAGIAQSPSFTTTVGAATTITVYPARLDAGSNFAQTQLLRPGINANQFVTVPVATSSGNGSVVPTSVTIPADGATLSATSRFTANAVGSTNIFVGPVGGFSSPVGSAASVTANIQPLTWQFETATTVGNRLAAANRIQLNGTAPQSGLSFTLTSLDPSRLLLAKNAADPGANSIIVTVNGNAQFSPNFYLQGFADNGTVFVSVQSSDSTTQQFPVSLAPATIVIGGNTPGGSIQSTPGGAAQPVTVFSGYLNAFGVFGGQQPAANNPISVPVSSSTPSVGTIGASPVTIAVGATSAATTFIPGTAGSTSLFPTLPIGFVASGTFGSVTATVGSLNCSVSAVGSVGNRLQAQAAVNINGSTTQNVLITSNSPGLALVSASKTQAGTPTATVQVTPGIPAAFYVQALASSGTPTFSCSAPGYTSGPAASATLAPSGVVIVGTGGVGLPFMQATVGTPSNISVSTVYLNPDGSVTDSGQIQPLAAREAAVTVQTTNTDPTAGPFPSQVTINPGVDVPPIVFTPSHTGSVTVGVVQPLGFTKPAVSGLTDNTSLVVSIH